MAGFVTRQSVVGTDTDRGSAQRRLIRWAGLRFSSLFLREPDNHDGSACEIAVKQHLIPGNELGPNHVYVNHVYVKHTRLGHIMEINITVKHGEDRTTVEAHHGNEFLYIDETTIKRLARLILVENPVNSKARMLVAEDVYVSGA